MSGGTHGGALQHLQLNHEGMTGVLQPAVLAILVARCLRRRRRCVLLPLAAMMLLA